MLCTSASKRLYALKIVKFAHGAAALKGIASTRSAGTARHTCTSTAWVNAFSFFHCVASPFHSFVTTSTAALPAAAVSSDGAMSRCSSKPTPSKPAPLQMLSKLVSIFMYHCWKPVHLPVPEPQCFVLRDICKGCLYMPATAGSNSEVLQGPHIVRATLCCVALCCSAARQRLQQVHWSETIRVSPMW